MLNSINWCKDLSVCSGPSPKETPDLIPLDLEFPILPSKRFHHRIVKTTVFLKTNKDVNILKNICSTLMKMYYEKNGKMKPVSRNSPTVLKPSFEKKEIHRYALSGSIPNHLIYGDWHWHDLSMEGVGSVFVLVDGGYSQYLLRDLDQEDIVLNGSSAFLKDGKYIGPSYLGASVTLRYEGDLDLTGLEVAYELIIKSNSVYAPNLKKVINRLSASYKNFGTFPKLEEVNYLTIRGKDLDIPLLRSFGTESFINIKNSIEFKNVTTFTMLHLIGSNFVFCKHVRGGELSLLDTRSVCFADKGSTVRRIDIHSTSRDGFVTKVSPCVIVDRFSVSLRGSDNYSPDAGFGRYFRSIEKIIKGPIEDLVIEDKDWTDAEISLRNMRFSGKKIKY